MLLESGSAKGKKEVLLTSIADAYKYASSVFTKFKRDIDTELPHFQHNYGVVKAKFSMGHMKRKDMPVIDKKDMKPLKKLLVRDKIPVKMIKIPAIELTPIQDQVYLSKVAIGIAKNGQAESRKYITSRSIIISSDKYIVDGHHRYLSAMLNDPSIKLKAMMVDLPIKELLTRVTHFGDNRGNKRNEMKNTPKFKEFLSEITCAEREKPITSAELNHLEKLLDGLFKSLGIDIEFTRHFLDRLNDKRNGKQITKCELAKVYTEVYKKFGPKLKNRTKRDVEKIIKSFSTKINIPVVLKWNDRSKEIEMVAKTIMRKHNFKGSDPVMQVEDKDEN